MKEKVVYLSAPIKGDGSGNRRDDSLISMLEKEAIVLMSKADDRRTKEYQYFEDGNLARITVEYQGCEIYGEGDNGEYRNRVTIQAMPQIPKGLRKLMYGSGMKEVQQTL